MSLHLSSAALLLVVILGFTQPRPAVAASVSTDGNFTAMRFNKVYQSPWWVQPGKSYVSQPVVGLKQFDPSLGTLTAIVATIATYWVQGSGVTGIGLVARNRPHSIFFHPDSARKAPVVLELSLMTNSVNPQPLWQNFGRLYVGCGSGSIPTPPCSYSFSFAMGPARNNYATKEQVDILPVLVRERELQHFIGNSLVPPGALSMLLRYPDNVKLTLVNLNSGEARIGAAVPNGGIVELTYHYCTRSFCTVLPRASRVF